MTCTACHGQGMILNRWELDACPLCAAAAEIDYQIARDAPVQMRLALVEKENPAEWVRRAA